MKKCKSDYDAKITEALYVKKEVPSLNKQLFNPVVCIPSRYIFNKTQFNFKYFILFSSVYDFRFDYCGLVKYVCCCDQGYLEDI